MEEWRNVPGFEWKYQVSNLGRFAKIKNGKRYVRRATLFDTGYYCVSITVDKNTKMVSLHRVLAETFVPKYGPGTVVNHIDGDPTNNDLGNLEWCTQRKNCIHRNRVLGHGSQPNARRAVICIETGMVFDSLRDAAKFVYGKKCDPAATVLNGISSHIRDCCLGRPCHKTCHGYHWKFL